MWAVTKVLLDEKHDRGTSQVRSSTASSAAHRRNLKSQKASDMVGIRFSALGGEARGALKPNSPNAALSRSQQLEQRSQNAQAT